MTRIVVPGHAAGPGAHQQRHGHRHVEKSPRAGAAWLIGPLWTARRPVARAQFLACGLGHVSLPYGAARCAKRSASWHADASSKSASASASCMLIAPPFDA